jgi:D-lactate dehydrogenase (cytochrome)
MNQETTMNAPLHLDLPAHLLPQIAQRDVPEAFIDRTQGPLWCQLLHRAGGARAAWPRRVDLHDVPPPSAVVFAESTRDVADAVKLCERSTRCR